jgi:hypothetical protein
MLLWTLATADLTSRHYMLKYMADSLRQRLTAIIDQAPIEEIFYTFAHDLCVHIIAANQFDEEAISLGNEFRLYYHLINHCL